MIKLDFDIYDTQIITGNFFNDASILVAQPVSETYTNENEDDVEALLKLGVLYWRRKNYDRSEHMLKKALELSKASQDVNFKSQCYVSLALVETSLEKIEEAIEAYEQAIMFTPENLHILNNLAPLYLRQGKTEKAVNALKKSLNGNPNDVVVWNKLANIYYEDEKIDEAIEAYKNAVLLGSDPNIEHLKSNENSLAANSQSVLSLLRLAALYTKKNLFTDAISVYQKALMYATRSAEIWNEIGSLYLKLDAYEDAEKALLKAIRLKPDNGEAYLNLAYVYTKQNKYSMSIPYYIESLKILNDQQDKSQALDSLKLNVKSLREAIEQDTDEPKVDINEDPLQDPATWFYSKYNDEFSASSYLLPNKPSESVETDKKDNSTPSSIQDLKTGNAMPISQVEGDTFQGKSPAKSMQTKSDDIGENEENPYAWTEKGNFHFINRSYEEAIIAYEKAIEIDPNYGQPYNNLALIQFLQGNYNEAILLYKKGIKLLTSNQEKAIVWNGLGNSYRRVKDYENARLAYQNASSLDQERGGAYEDLSAFETDENHKTPDFWNDLGFQFFRIGVYDKAAEAFKQAIQLEPTSGYPYSYLARVLTAKGQYKEAVSLFQKSIDMLTNDQERAKIWNRLGDAHRKLNEYDNALKAYKNASDLIDDKSSLLNRTRLSLLSNCAIKQ